MKTTRQLFFNQTSTDIPQESFQRSSELNHAIQQSFENLTKINMDKSCGYVFLGADCYGFTLCNIIDINSNDIIQHNILKNKKMIICDVGAGNGRFSSFNRDQYNDNVITYSITSHDFRENKNDGDLYYIIANGEYLDEFCQERNIKFDSIFSHKTFMHFVDPIGSVMAAYKALAIGGNLFIDEFNLPGCGPEVFGLIEYLQSQGYLVLGTPTNVGCLHMRNFIIQKTEDKPDLVMPFVLGNIISEHASYRANADLMTYSQSSMERKQNLLEQGKLFVKEKVENNPLHKCEDLAHLLSNPEFTCNNEEAYWLILYMATKNVHVYKEYCLLYQQYINEENEVLFQSCWQLSCRHNENKILALMCNIYFPQLSVEQQLKIITLLGISELIDCGKTKQDKDMLEKMDIPFEERNNKHWYQVLKFPKIEDSVPRAPRNNRVERFVIPILPF
jgi:SAM-dependent methyltransferase